MANDKEIEFADGLLVKLPRDGAPEYVIGSLSIKRQEFIDWLSKREGDWVNLEMKKAKSGKPYAAVDNWKPDAKKSQDRQPARGGGGYANGGRNPSGDDFPDDSAIPF